MQASNEYPSSIRVGKVKEFDPEKLRARVSFPDMGIVSHWLPMLVLNTLKTKDEYYLDKGEHVVCLMQGTGEESGFILGAIYDDKNKPKIKDPKKNTRAVTFDDGTLIKYNRKDHELTINCVDKITIIAQNVNTTAQTVNVNAPHITLSGSSILFDGGTITLDGSVICPGYCRC